MTKTKTFLLFLCLAISSCSKESVLLNTPNDKQKRAPISGVNIDNQLSSLINTYCNSGNSEGEGEGGENNPSKKRKKEKTDIAKADMEGFAIGYAVGGTIGGAIGSFAGGQFGAAIGSLIGGGLAGTAYSIVWSMNKADEVSVSLVEQYNRIGTIPDVQIIINDSSTSEPLFAPQILNANIGYLHNFAISQIYNQYDNSIFSLNAGEILDLSYNHLYSMVDRDMIEDIQYSTNTIDNDFSTFYGTTDAIEYDEYILLYLEAIPLVEESQICEFTQEYMSIINDFIDDTDQVSYINGCISTFVYSYLLWEIIDNTIDEN